MVASGVSPKLMFRKSIIRGLKQMIPNLKRNQLKSLMVGKGVGERRASDAEVARAVEMSGSGAKRRTAPLKFRM